MVTDARLRLIEARQKLRDLRREPYGPRHVLVGDVSGNVEIPGTDLVLGRVSATGRPIVLHNPARRVLGTGQAIQVYPMGETAPAGWYIEPSPRKQALYIHAQTTDPATLASHFNFYRLEIPGVGVLPTPTTPHLISIGQPPNPSANWLTFSHTFAMTVYNGLLHAWYPNALGVIQDVYATQGDGIWHHYNLPASTISTTFSTISLFKHNGGLYAAYKISNTTVHVYRLITPNDFELVDIFPLDDSLHLVASITPETPGQLLVLANADGGDPTSAVIQPYTYDMGSTPVWQGVTLDGLGRWYQDNRVMTDPSGTYLFGHNQYESVATNRRYRHYTTTTWPSGWSLIFTGSLIEDQQPTEQEEWKRREPSTNPAQGVYFMNRQQERGESPTGLIHYTIDPLPGSFEVRRVMLESPSRNVTLVSFLQAITLQQGGPHSVLRLPLPDRRILVSVIARPTSTWDGGIYAFDEKFLQDSDFLALDWHLWLPIASFGSSGTRGGVRNMMVDEDIF